MGSRTLGKLYPIALDDYPKLLRYKVSEKGVYYIEDLIREIYVEQKDISLNNSKTKLLNTLESFFLPKILIRYLEL